MSDAEDKEFLEELKNLPKESVFESQPDKSKSVLTHLEQKLNIQLKEHWLSGWCPVQAEGFIRVSPKEEWSSFYFRARGNHWRMLIAKGDKDAYAVYYDKGFPKESTEDLFIAEADYGTDQFAAGYMNEEDSLKFIEETIVKWIDYNY